WCKNLTAPGTGDPRLTFDCTHEVHSSYQWSRCAEGGRRMSPASMADASRFGWRGPLPDLRDGHALMRVSAQPAPRFLKRGIDPVDRPAVGDFVIVASGSPPHIVEVLPRRGALTRAAAGERYARQVIAANVDIVLVLMGLDRDFNAARAERYIALIDGSNAQPVILLTKIDKVDRARAAEALSELSSRLPQVPLHAINGKDAGSVRELDRYLQPGVTAVLVGSSGAGKSTLTNTLL